MPHTRLSIWTQSINHTLTMLSLLYSAALGFNSCSVPGFDWMVLDQGAGSSMSYALAVGGSSVYMGGHTTCARLSSCIHACCTRTHASTRL